MRNAITTIKHLTTNICSCVDVRTELNRVTNTVILRAATADAAGALLDGRAIAGGAWALAELEPQPSTTPGSSTCSSTCSSSSSSSSSSSGGDDDRAGAGGSHTIYSDGGCSNVLLVDPPRAGLDAPTLRICHRFDHILYISCNPKALHQNLHGATCEQV